MEDRDGRACIGKISKEKGMRRVAARGSNAAFLTFRLHLFSIPRKYTVHLDSTTRVEVPRKRVKSSGTGFSIVKRILSGSAKLTDY